MTGADVETFISLLLEAGVPPSEFQRDPHCGLICTPAAQRQFETWCGSVRPEDRQALRDKVRRLVRAASLSVVAGTDVQPAADGDRHHQQPDEDQAAFLAQMARELADEVRRLGLDTMTDVALAGIDPDAPNASARALALPKRMVARLEAVAGAHARLGAALRMACPGAPPLPPMLIQ